MTTTVGFSPSASISIWRWAALQLRRDLRGSGLRFVFLATVLAVTALTSVAFFATRVQAALQRDAAQLLGADLVLVSDHPLADTWAQEARARGLQMAATQTTSSMLRALQGAGAGSKLVSLKAVSPSYPLRGRLRIGELDAQARLVAVHDAPPGGPCAGCVWLDPQVQRVLGLKRGDPVALGDLTLRVDATLAMEPDRGAGFVNFAPRAMMRLDDLAATGLMQPGSRVGYRLLMAESAAQAGVGIKGFQAWAGPPLKHARGMRLETLEQGRPDMQETLSRAGDFLHLVSLLGALMSSLVVAMVSRGFAQSRLDACALLRTLGMSQATIARSYALEFAAVGLAAALVGTSLGWLLHGAFVQMLGQLLEMNLPAPGWSPVALGLAVGILITLGFGLPPVLQLAQVPAMRVLRRELGSVRSVSILVALAAVLGLAGILMLAAGNWRLGAIALGGFAAAMAVFALASQVAIGLLGQLDRRAAQRLPLSVHLALQQLRAQGSATLLHISALAMGLMALMLLVLLRTDLLDSWHAATPPDAPDHFVIGIQSDQVRTYTQMLRDAGIQQADCYPMARARLVAVNGRSVDASNYRDERAKRLVDREFNLSFAAQAPSYNSLVAGQFTAGGAHGLSVEAGLAKTLGLHLGDALSFDMAGERVSGQVTSLRAVNWSSMRVNFFVIVPQAQMPQWPVSYVSAFRMPASGDLERRLVQAYPGITVVDVSATLAQLQAVVAQVSSAVELLFGFTMAAGLLVLIAGLSGSRQQRTREWAIMRALGAGAAQLRRVQTMEALLIGAVAGLLAAAAAWAVGWALVSEVFDFEWRSSWMWPPLSVACACALSWLSASWSLRGTLERPVTATLQALE